MSEQDATQSSTKQRRRHKTNTDNQDNGKQTPAAQRPSNDDTEGWKAHWKGQGQLWRTAPEIDMERQEYLTERRNIKSDWKQGNFPFKEIKLTRADVEWLLAKEESESNLAASQGETQHTQKGLDLRAADLSDENLSGLPLVGIYGGLTGKARLAATKEQRQMAAVHMERCNLQNTSLAEAKYR